jgi:hypothetical protein
MIPCFQLRGLTSDFPFRLNAVYTLFVRSLYPLKHRKTLEEPLKDPRNFEFDIGITAGNYQFILNPRP